MKKQNREITTTKKINPRLHQKEAVEATCKSLFEEGNDRVKVIMPCGTGKTLVQLWTCEEAGAKTILVLLPSLALVRQSLHEWLVCTSWKSVKVLAVCSDNTVTDGLEDEIILTEADIDFPVTNNPDKILAFLSTSSKVTKLVFSTYHSADLVAAGMPDGFIFDIGIFDEAHKTATHRKGIFTFALADENLPIGKRVFYTATPRHYVLPKTDEAENKEPLVYSMDDEVVYGTIAYQLSFREAVKHNIICDYEVIVSVVTNNMLEAKLLEDGQVEINGKMAPAKQVAHCVALTQAVKQHSIRKVFTFHPRVRDAMEFTNGGPQSVAHHLPNDFVITHVNGKMTTSKREVEMDRFRKAKRAIISNARCLTEGVDVPTVDMVGFLSKKRELIDIVQATGRAMRRAPGKVKGYILVPLYVEQEGNESIEAAVTRADFREVWAVLNAMREQDETLALNITRIRTERGRNGPRVKDPIDLDPDHVSTVGPTVALGLLCQAITTMVVNGLTTSWDEMYGRLLKFKEEHGHCNVPQKAKKRNELTQWVSIQRVKYNEKTLSAKKVALLEKIGFTWSILQTRWDRMFEELKKFKEEHKHCNIPHDVKKYTTLWTWANSQRVRHKEGTLTNERITRLESIGFSLDLHTDRWTKMYDELVKFKRTNGHCNVPQLPHTDLGMWVNKQRINFSAGKLNSERKNILDSIGFVYNTRDALWDEMYEKLKEFKKKNDHCNVEPSTNRSLYNWVYAQRRKHKLGKVNLNRVKRLNELGFEWSLS